MDMNKKSIIVSVALLAVLFSGCSEDNPGMEETKNLSIQTGIETRALKSTFGDNDELGIYVMSSPTGLSWYNNVSGICKATYNKGGWMLNPAVGLNESTAYILACYPYVSQAVDPEAIPVNTAAQVDYLYAGASNTASITSPSVTLSMRHAMTNFRFNIANTGYTAGEGILQSVSIANNSGKKVLFSEGTLNAGTGEITGKSGANASYTISDINKTAVSQGWAEDMPAAMLIPFIELAAGDVQFIVTIDNRSYTIDCPLLSGGYAMGKQYTFTFELSSSGLTLFPEDVTVEVWGDTNGTVSPKSNITYTVNTTKANQVISAPDMGSATGIVSFGDGSSADYTPNLQHTYSSVGTYKVDMRVKTKATKVNFSDISSVGEIDLSSI